MSSLDVRSIDDKDLRRQPAPATKQAFRVFLSEHAFDRAVARGDSDLTREIGGVLVGEILKDDAGPYLMIDDTVDALHAEEKGAELTFTHATWEHIHKEMDSKHQKKRVVGWYHTHPGFGVFLSDRDQFIHKSFFNLPFQVALVYDPKTHEHGVFTWHDNEVWRARRYWIGPREHVWDGQRAPTDLTNRKPAAPAADEPAAKATGGDDWTLGGALAPLAMIGVLVLLIGGFVGHWLGVGSANQALGEAQLEMVKAKADGAATTMSSLQHDLVGVLRDTLGDEALRRPLAQAVGELDHAINMLAMMFPGAANLAPPAAPSVAIPGVPGMTIPGMPGMAMPSMPSVAIPGVPGVATPGAPGAATPGAPVPSMPTATTPVELAAQLTMQLRVTRDSLILLSQNRGSAQAALSQLERMARPASELRADLGHDVSEQRSGLGALYAELASDALKIGDPARARRLLAAAAHFDPRNRARYETQLQSFDRTAKLPPELDEGTMR